MYDLPPAHYREPAVGNNPVISVPAASDNFMV